MDVLFKSFYRINVHGHTLGNGEFKFQYWKKKCTVELGYTHMVCGVSQSLSKI